MEKLWTSSEIIKLFRMTETSKTPLMYAEEKGDIPKADRVPRGKISVRKWKTSQLPKIGEKFGFLKKPEHQIVCSIYTPKGGVTKTTFTANLARMLAINGIKTLVCGLDFQKSITRYLLPNAEIKSLDEIEDNHTPGIHHLLFEGAKTSSVIKKTDLPTLDVIPETSDLNFMAKKIRLENRREYLFKERLLPKLSEYDVILFDGNPGWSDLTENALVAADNLIMPVSCEIECYDALQENLGEIEDFRQAMQISWENYYMIPTLLENNSMSQNIYARYLNKYQKSIISLPIRKAVVAQEARLVNLSIIEHSPMCSLATDYHEVISKLWKRLNSAGDLDD